MQKLFIYIRFIGCFLFTMSITKMDAQPAAINFHKLGFSEGLHDGIIRSIAQDKYGYIWIASVGAVNRFDGTKITQFTHISGDSTSPYGTQPRSLLSDISGRFWIGSETGLMEYDFSKGHFKRIRAFQNQFIVAMESISDSCLLISTRRGLFRYNTKNNAVYNLSSSALPAHAAVKNIRVQQICRSNGMLYLASTGGLITMNTTTGETRVVDHPDIKEVPLLSVSADRKGDIWIAGTGSIKLGRLSDGLTHFTSYDKLLPAVASDQFSGIVGVVPDNNDRVWVITPGAGLYMLHPAQQQFTSYLHNIHLSASPSSNDYRYIFKDNTGIIWLGMETEGINYFEPNQNLFTTLLPFPANLQEKYSKAGRAVAVDKQGHIWMGNHDGLSRYNPITQQYTVWRNEKGQQDILYSNTIRSLHCDDKNYLWIGTAAGVNRYDVTNNKMEFISNHQLPRSFYNSINQDKSGNIWFCTNDSASLYWYVRAEDKYYSLSHHPQLKKYAGLSPTSYLLEDSQQRIWISFARQGVVMLDKRTGLVQHYTAAENGVNNIIGNQVIDIKEDKDGIIWLATFNGVTAINVEKNTITNYNRQNGLAGNMTSSILVDSLNRIWIGANGGLTMFGQNRKQSIIFSVSDGLSSVGFPEHAGITAPNGDIIMPTYNGYFRFNPVSYEERPTTFNFYVSGYRVFDKEYFRINEADENPVLELKPYQSSFTFYLDALNYANPSQTWFAYKLEGFEKEWHYTQDAKAVYTNVPGGRYHFVYKATSNNRNWEQVTPKKISIHLRSYFYKTSWFKILIALLLAGFLYAFYRYRTRQQQQVYQLKEKAQALEKEKAQVMYENLKQQLNPHFLFNSLTSLNSLIDADPKTASEFLDSLSKTYRYILKSRDHETVPLVDEIRFATNYIKLQQTRFEKGFEVNLHISEEYYHRKIVPVTLQNLVENAIKHNIIDEESPLVVNIFIENDQLVVQNNLQKKKFVETSNRLGLANLQSLYQYLSNQPVEIVETPNSFTIKLPLL